MAGWVTKLAGLSVGTALLAATVPYLHNFDLSALSALPLFPSSSPTPELFACLPQNYTTQIISLDPLVIYIHSFLNNLDIAALLASAEGAFAPSHVTKYGRKQPTPDRTSWSAGLSRDEPAVQCILSRAQSFMGTTFAPGRDEMGPPQAVRYTAKQRFNIHHDWYDRPQPSPDGRNRHWNRVASFFAILQDNCTEGETYFPYIEAVEPQRGAGDRLWKEHEKGGLAFQPVAGNALFWVNLHANGTGDRRVMHAGLPVGEGLKTAMNIWPRQYLGPEAWGDEVSEAGVEV